MLAVIGRRKYFEERRQKTLVSWHARTTASYTAGGYMTDGKGNPALDSALKLSIDELERLQMEDMAKAIADAPPVHKEPESGSFERLMLTFGKTVQK